MSRQHATRPRWIADTQRWQAGLLRNPSLTPGEKLTVLALSRRFTSHDGVMVNLDEIARETGQTVTDVRAALARLNGTFWTVRP